MARKSYIQINGVLYDKAELVCEEAKGVPAILGDIPDFVSSIDGTLVSGRAGLRDHCARHNVVPTEELKGLPPRTMVNNDFDPAYRQGTKNTLAEIINSRGYFRRK